jgi:hypothetical protein
MDLDFTRRQRQLCENRGRLGVRFSRSLPQSSKPKAPHLSLTCVDFGDAGAPVDTSR